MPPLKKILLIVSTALTPALLVPGAAAAHRPDDGTGQSEVQSEKQTITPKKKQAIVVPKTPVQKELDVDVYNQDGPSNCGPASSRIALSAFGEKVSEWKLAKEYGTTDAGTDSISIVTKGLNRHQNKYDYKTYWSPSKEKLRSLVRKAVSKGAPVVANIGGGVTDTHGRSHFFEGHYLTISGYSPNNVRISDSWLGKTYWVSYARMSEWIGFKGVSA
jgi:uncharacterized protein YvpB